ncbi:MAG TPA: SDR family oxidoreductase [Casimicrobiaceae bacterium]|nr:SDR family oxidoreductase [Casimicrobiaceae bacterium]
MEKTIIVTGASRGIGHATALRFHESGWRVITVSREPPPGACPWSIGRSHILLDLSDLDTIGRCVELMREMLDEGELHALVNNAGTSPKGPGGSRLNSLDTDIATWQSMYNTNFYAPLLLTRGFARELAKARGAVVNLTSIAGSRVHPFAGSAYATSKAALAALTRELAFDLAPAGVRVNAIAPGEIDTAILSPGTPQIVERDVPMHRLGTTAEVADLIWFLCSPQASYITGAEIPINGGQHV